MTPDEQELLEKYLAHLNLLGDEGSYPDFEAWYQEVRYAQGPEAQATLEEASELRYKDILDAARVFNWLQEPAQTIAQGLTALRQRRAGSHRRGVRRPCKNRAPGGQASGLATHQRHGIASAPKGLDNSQNRTVTRKSVVLRADFRSWKRREQN